MTDPLQPFGSPGIPEPAAFGVPHQVERATGGSPLTLTENGLPQRVRQASLAPQLRRPAGSPSPAHAAPSSRSPETARKVMSAFWRGWQRGQSDADAEPDHGTDLPQDGESR